MIPLRDENPTSRFAWFTLLLVVANVAVYFVIQPASSSGRFEYEHAAIPCEITTGQPLSIREIVDATQLGVERCTSDDTSPEYFPDKHVLVAILVSMFLHGSLLHLGGNMLFLWVFGNNIEDRFGSVRYVAFYLVAGLVATLAHVAVQPHSTVPLIGASGAVAGVMGAYLVWFPNARVRTLVMIGVIPLVPQIRAKWLLLIWFASQFFLNANSGVAWMAHVGGFGFGVLVALLHRRPRQPAEPALNW